MVMALEEHAWASTTFVLQSLKTSEGEPVTPEAKTVYPSSTRDSVVSDIRRTAQSKNDVLVDVVDTIAIAIVFVPCWM